MQKPLTISIVTAVLSVTNVFLFNPVTAVKDGFIWLLNIFVQALFGFAGWLVTETIAILLFFPPPTQVPELVDMYWGVTFPLFWALVSVVGTGFFLGQQLFPHSDSADVEKFMKRVFFAVVMVFVVGYGFGLVVEFVNLIGQFLYPEHYRITVGGSLFEGLATAGLTGLSVLIFGIFGGTSTIITYLMFLVMLGMRMVIVYTMYTMFPILIALWITDIGPFKYGKMMAGLVFKASIVMLLFGVLLAAILGVGGALATNADGEVPGEELGDREDLIVEGSSESRSRTAGGIYADENAELSSHGSKDPLTSAWVSVYTYFAAIWLCITLTGLILGGTVSSGFASSMATAGNFKGGMVRMKSRMNSDSGKGFGRASKDAKNYSPDAEDATEAASMSEKLDYVTGGRASDAKDVAEKAKDKAEDAADTIDEEVSAAGNKVESGVTKGGSKAGEAIGSVAGETGAAVGKAVGETAGKVTGKAANVTISAAGKIPKASMKASSLAVRGGKAYGKVFAQPDPMSSIGEMARIARESPIGHPDKPDDEGTEDGPKPEEDIDLEDLDQEQSESHRDAEGHGEVDPDDYGRPKGEESTEVDPTDTKETKEDMEGSDANDKEDAKSEEGTTVVDPKDTKGTKEQMEGGSDSVDADVEDAKSEDGTTVVDPKDAKGTKEQMEGGSDSVDADVEDAKSEDGTTVVDPKDAKGTKEQMEGESDSSDNTDME